MSQTQQNENPAILIQSLLEEQRKKIQVETERCEQERQKIEIQRKQVEEQERYNDLLSKLFDITQELRTSVANFSPLYVETTKQLVAIAGTIEEVCSILIFKNLSSNADPEETKAVKNIVKKVREVISQTVRSAATNATAAPSSVTIVNQVHTAKENIEQVNSNQDTIIGETINE